MKKKLIALLVICQPLLGFSYNQSNSKDQLKISVASFTPPTNTNRMQLFDLGWKFYKGEMEGSEKPGFDDSQWRNIDLPHDWSIEDLPNQKEGEIVGPFDKNSIGVFFTGFTNGGTGWYRKSFIINEADEGKKISIYFDGVFHETEVWINGQSLGQHKHGYTPFYFELNDYLNKPGEKNTIAIHVRNIGENNRWYSGSGIYRHVWLRVTDPLYIPVWGVFVTTPEISEIEATVLANISIENEKKYSSEFILKNTILDTDGKIVSSIKNNQILDAGEKAEIEQELKVPNPDLWSTESPTLYTLRTELVVNKEIIDSEETKFGIRSIQFSPESGFLLNGKPTLLRGACIHHDNGPLGAVAIERADQRKIKILKDNGFNAIRTSHNPPSESFLNACDQYGILVMDEIFDMWENPKRPDDYHQFFKEWHKKDLRSMVLRDRNHPSIIMWSIGNEIKERADSLGVEIGKKLINIIKDIDTTRAVTNGICEFWETPGRPWEESAPAYAILDVCGYNYVHGEYEKDHAEYPERIIAGTESFALDIYENWKMAHEKPYVIGDFVWTGMDYIGEAGIGQVMIDSTPMNWPWIISNCGDIDLIGYKKPQAYYRDVVWDRSPLEMEVEEIAPEGKNWVIRDWGWKRTYRSWNWTGYEGENMNVYVYTKAEEVRLELNGKIVETQTSSSSSKFTYIFNVPYKPGELKAIAFSKGKEIATKILKTTGPVAKIKIIPDRKEITADRNDLAYLTVELIDEQGDRVVDSDDMVNFAVEGDAEIVAVGNANPREPKSFQTPSCNAFHGRCLVILRPTGKVGKATLIAKLSDANYEKCMIKIK